MKNIPIGEVLKEYGYITEEQILKALEYQKTNKDKRLGDVLIILGFVSETQMLDALAKRLGLKRISFNDVAIDVEAVKVVPKQLCLKYSLIAFSKDEGQIKVAMSDPLNYYAIEDVRLLANLPIEIYLCEKSNIISAVEYNYAEIDARSVAETTRPEISEAFTAAPTNTNDESPVVKLLNSLLVKGYNSNASDIHIEPFEESTYVRIRIDGMMVDYVKISKSLHTSVIARTKIMSNLNIAEKRIPQDGHFKATIEGIELNVRVSVIPTVYGEKAVLRFLNSNTELDHKEHFGMTPENFEKLNFMLKKPHGIIYITGPTGSGKTTTLYMAIEKLAKKPVNISTIEDPVEKNLNRINQMQVNVQAGLTFETGLRALLRQDPDIIMVGETRDAQTASISVSAAITGHLVLSTLHTNDAVSTIARLGDMGVDSYLIASSLNGVVAQRLVRKICPNCKKMYAPSENEQRILSSTTDKLYKGDGCHVCNFTGYKGRQSIHEILVIDKQIIKMISAKSPVEDIFEYAVKDLKMKTLFDSMRELVLKGISTTEELLKLSYNV